VHECKSGAKMVQIALGAWWWCTSAARLYVSACTVHLAPTTEEQAQFQRRRRRIRDSARTFVRNLTNVHNQSTPRKKSPKLRTYHMTKANILGSNQHIKGTCRTR
jgi:hypothetical protein